MKQRLRLLAAILLLALTFTSVPSANAASSSGNFIAGELIVKVQPGTRFQAKGLAEGLHASRINTLLKGTGVWEAQSLGDGSDTYLVSLGWGADTDHIMARLANDPAVIYAERNAIRTMMRTPNDPIIGQQWALRNIQAYEAWDITTGEAVVIAIADTGISSSHPDLSKKLVPGYNALTGTGDANDDEGHGTAMAGVAAAVSDNGSGIAGVCWGCKLMPIKVLNRRGASSDAIVARGVRWAVDNGARIINLSLGGPDESQVLRDMAQYAHDRGALLIASSGNGYEDGNATNYPAAYDTVLAVSATGNSDVVTGFSTTGPFVDISAPGVGIWTTSWSSSQGDGYAPGNGTSPAAPHVSGTAGLIWSIRPDLSASDVRCVMEASSDDKGPAGKDNEYGWGRLNTLKALQLAQSYAGCPLNQPAPPSDPAPQPDQPAPSDAAAAFAPVAPVVNSDDLTYFYETSHTLRNEFKRYWERHGGLPIFGFPISEEFSEQGADGQVYTVQYFERHRFEYHPENAAPYNVQLSRLGDDILKIQGRDWYNFPKGAPADGCLYFEQTGHSLCGGFLSYWRANGLEFDGRSGKSFDESMALFGQPLSEPQPEEVAPGVWVTVQWFERARFEDHNGQILLGLLSSDLARARGLRP